MDDVSVAYISLTDGRRGGGGALLVTGDDIPGQLARGMSLSARLSDMAADCLRSTAQHIARPDV